jgi:hypothetical protein
MKQLQKHSLIFDYLFPYLILFIVFSILCLCNWKLLLIHGAREGSHTLFGIARPPIEEFDKRRILFCYSLCIHIFCLIQIVGMPSKARSLFRINDEGEKAAIKKFLLILANSTFILNTNSRFYR